MWKNDGIFFAYLPPQLPPTPKVYFLSVIGGSRNGSSHAAFDDFYGKWLISSYQSRVTEHRVGKKQNESALVQVSPLFMAVFLKKSKRNI